MMSDSPVSCSDRKPRRECIHQLVAVLGLDRLTETAGFRAAWALGAPNHRGRRRGPRPNEPHHRSLARRPAAVLVEETQPWRESTLVP